MTYSLTVRSPDPGDKSLVTALVSTDPGSTCPTDIAAPKCRSVTMVQTPGLTIAATTGQASTAPGGAVTTTVTVTDSGQTSYSAATFAVQLAGSLDDGSYDSTATTASRGSTSTSGTVLTWTGALAPGDVATITYRVVVNSPDPAPADHVVAASVTSASLGANCVVGTESGCATSVPVAELSVLNGVDVSTTKPTGQVRYTTSFTNTGKVAYTGFTLQDNFRDALDDGTYNGDATASSGSLIFGSDIGQVGILFWKGDLAIGQTVTVTGSFTVKNPDPGNHVLRTLVTSDVTGSSCPTGTTATACRTSVTVLTPGLRISTAVDRATVQPAQAATYTITVANTGQTDYAGAKITDSLVRILDDARYDGNAGATSGVVGVSGSLLTWTGDLAVGSSVTITFSATVNHPDQGDRMLQDSVASSELGSTCVAGSTDPACSAAVDVVAPALNISTSASTTTVTPGGTVGYTITVRNVGNGFASSALVRDDLSAVLDDARYAGDVGSDVGSATVAAGMLTWTGDLAVGQTVTITYSVAVLDPDTGDRTLTNGAGSPFPDASCQVGTTGPCMTTVRVLLPGLSVATTADAATATPGDTVHFTVTVTDTGETPYPAATVSAALGDLLDDASYTGDVVASSGTPTVTGSTLAWSGNLDVGGSATITYSMAVHDPDAGNRTLATSVQSPAQGSSCPVGGTSPACAASVTVLIPALALTQSTSAATATPGSVVRYTVTVANDGQTAQPAATFAEDLSGVLTDATFDGDTVATAGAASVSAGVLSWTGNLAVGASATVTFSVTVKDPDPGDKTLNSRLTSPSPGSTCPVTGTPDACFLMVQVLVPRLDVATTADTATVIAGSAVRYTVTFTNSGQTPYAGAQVTDSLAGALDDGTYRQDASATRGSVRVDGSVLTWTGDLAVGDTATVTYSILTALPPTGDHTLLTTVSSPEAGSGCPVAGTPSACSTTVQELVPALSIVKTADTTSVVTGGTVHYTVTAANTGQAAYGSAVVSDDLSGVLDDATYAGDATATSGGLGVTGSTLTWTGPLALGATVTLTYSVKVDDPDTRGDQLLTNRVSSASAGSRCSVGAPGPTCSTTTTVRPPSLTLTDLNDSFTLTGLPDQSATAEGAVTMTVTTDNPGGYLVTAESGGAALTSTTPGTTATIGVPRLFVRESGTPTFHPMSDTLPVLVHEQSGPSEVGGDAVSNDYRVDVPFVPSGRYTGTIDYLVTAP